MRHAASSLMVSFLFLWLLFLFLWLLFFLFLWLSFYFSGLIIFVLFLYSSQTIGAAQWFYSIKDHFLSAASNPLRTTLGYDRLSGNMLGEKLKQNFLFLLTFKFFHNFIFEINWNLPCCFDLLFVMRPFAELTNLNNIAEPNLNFILISSV